MVLFSVELLAVYFVKHLSCLSSTSKNGVILFFIKNFVDVVLRLYC